MKRATFIVTFAVALALLVAVPVTGMAMADASADTNETETAQETDDLPDQANETAPGERLSGILGVQEAELEGDIEQRTFGIQIAQAASEGAQADVVGERLGAIEQRLNDLEERNNTLQEAREAGEISEGQYRAGMAILSAESQTTAQLTNQTEHVAGQLPADVLEAQGVNVDAIQTLKDRAANLSGEEVAAIAQEIAGPAVGDIPGSGPPIDLPVGEDERPGNGGSDERSDDRSDDERPGNGESDERPGDGGGDERSGDDSETDDSEPDDGESGDGETDDDRDADDEPSAGQGERP